MASQQAGLQTTTHGGAWAGGRAPALLTLQGRPLAPPGRVGECGGKQGPSPWWLPPQFLEAPVGLGFGLSDLSWLQWINGKAVRKVSPPCDMTQGGTAGMSRGREECGWFRLPDAHRRGLVGPRQSSWPPRGRRWPGRGEQGDSKGSLPSKRKNDCVSFPGIFPAAFPAVS